MLQPRRTSGFLLITSLLVLFSNCITEEIDAFPYGKWLKCIFTGNGGVGCFVGEYRIDSSPRQRRENSEDVTTVLLVDSQGRSTFGRFLSVKPDLGLLTSTARTFIQEGVTTEYATQVVGATLDNGRLYAHLLTKSSRVLYDNDSPTRSYNEHPVKKWNIDGNVADSKSVNFVKNTDYISPNQVEPFIVFPTTKPRSYKRYDSRQLETSEEILKSSSSNNARVPFMENVSLKVSTSESREPKFIALSNRNKQNNIKAFQINPQFKNVHLENAINYKDSSENDIPKKGDVVGPSKVREWDNLPTFTVRNEFSPSGYSFLEDFPDFEVSTEKSKSTTAAERKAKLLFRAGLQEKHDLKTVTYTGFADFTTTVGDTVIIFSPSTSEIPRPQTGHVTKIAGEATLRPSKATRQPFDEIVQPTKVLKKPVIESTHIPKTQKIESHKPIRKTRPTMVIDSSDRHRDPDDDEVEQHEDIDAKMAVLAHEQKGDIATPELEDVTTTEESVILPSSEAIEPSESQIPMLSTPSHEDIAKIFALLQAQDKKATQPLNTPATIFFDEKPSSTPNTEKDTQVFGGATTIFFEDDLQPTATTPESVSSKINERVTTNSPTDGEEATTDNIVETTSSEILTTSEDTENPSTIPLQETTPQFVNEIDVEKSRTTQQSIPETEAYEEEEEDEEQEVEEEEGKQQADDGETKATEEKEAKSEGTDGEVDKEKDEQEGERDQNGNEDKRHERKDETKNREDEDDDESKKDDNKDEDEYKKDDDEDEDIQTDIVCTEGEKIVPTTVYKTLTYLTTFFIPDEDSTSISINKNEIVSTEIGFQTLPCVNDVTVIPSMVASLGKVLEEDATSKPETSTHPKLEPTTEQLTTIDVTQETTPIQTFPSEITTESQHVTESEGETTEVTTEGEEQLELLFKTFYTTYNYLTTYFLDSTSSISTRKEVITNVITSTINPAKEATDPAVAGLLRNDGSSSYKSRPVSFEDFAGIEPSSVVHPATATLELRYNDENDDNVSGDESTKPTPALNDEHVLQTVNGVKTFYTTYTYFTTIFVDGETEISSRTEVYTNYVTPTKALDAIVPTAAPHGLESEEQLESPNVDETDANRAFDRKAFNTYNTTINRQKTASDDQTEIYDGASDAIDNNILTTPSYITLQRAATVESSENSLDLSEYETIATMVTDVRSSTSEGGRKIIDNVDKRNVLDDQIVSESNNDSEILPSPTLLLQTSYTTFTYFTTMYQGTTSSKVVSRLETITNVITETLRPTQRLSADDLNAPVTYFTTFTYWTTYYKQGTTRITSSEKTVSNIVTPSPVLNTAPTLAILPTTEPTIDISPSPVTDIQPTSNVGEDELTTFYTTFTYYTTSYVGNSTIINSRLETATNVVNNTVDVDSNQIGRALGSAEQNKGEDVKTLSADKESVGLLSTILSTKENSGTTTIFSTDVFGTYIDGRYAQVLESTFSIVTNPIETTKASEQPLKPTGVVSINQGKIVDAEGVSTLFYTTQAVGTYIDNQYAQVIDSTSNLVVDEEKKASLPTDIPLHRTGLVRLIEGSIVENGTTTFYQSKVLGTLIDGRYAQIIESTSSFLVRKKASVAPTPASEILPTPTKAPDQKIEPTSSPISPSPVVLESSISDSAKLDEENATESEEDIDDSTEKNSRVKSRLTYQSRKNTYVAIRPFAARPSRPTFAPQQKRKFATTISSDFTPTVTVVPASKQRFSGRKSSVPSVINPTASGSRRFSRPKSSAPGGVSSAFGGRGRSSSRIQPTAAGFGSSSRRGGFRSSGLASSGIRPSSLFNGNRQRIRPTPAIGLNRFGNSAVTPPSYSDEENDLTTLFTENPTAYTDEEGEQTLPTTTEVSKRSQNPLLRFRRPPLSRTPTTPRSASKSTGKNSRNGNRATTTAKPRSFSRPAANLQNRPRSNALFPRRGLFTTTTTPSPKDEVFEDDLEDLENEDGEVEDDTDYDVDSPTEPPAATRKGRSFGGPVQIKPFFRKRSKRQIPYSRFRRPGARLTTVAPKEEEPVTEVTKPPRTTKSRFINRRKSELQSTTQAPKRLSPTKASSQGRSQFTLRDSSSRSNFKRPTQPPPKRTTVASRPKAPRLRNSQNESSIRKSSQSKSPNRARNTRRGNVRTRQQHNSGEQIDSNFVLPSFDGTITVTHQIPTEVTIPVVNGKITEYKNIITAKYSTEVLGPQQYTTSINQFGKGVTILLVESTGIANNGATEITQFVLNEVPTTSVIFTPTYIRGRKTSYSHIIPSTVYGVEEVVNTIQPALAAQAPLANILLSQLLLGNVGNPLLGFQNPGMPSTPTTEYKTRTTTYTTTVTSTASTVIPLTFRGKEILTTIFDTSKEVITATEFITDTVVVTPTTGFPGGNQLNSLLVPLLLQQQQQPANPLLQQPAGVVNLAQEQPFAQALRQEAEEENLTIDENKAVEDEEEPDKIAEVVSETPKRKSRKNPKKPKPTPPASKETSIVTLYVSGRQPGDFTTILSTYVVGEESRRRREAAYVPVKPSQVIDGAKARTADIDSYLMPTTKEVKYESDETSAPTESLESVLGDVRKVTETSDLFQVKPTRTTKKYAPKKASKDVSASFLAL